MKQLSGCYNHTHNAFDNTLDGDEMTGKILVSNIHKHHVTQTCNHSS